MSTAVTRVPSPFQRLSALPNSRCRSPVWPSTAAFAASIRARSSGAGPLTGSRGAAGRARARRAARPGPAGRIPSRPPAGSRLRRRGQLVLQRIGIGALLQLADHLLHLPVRSSPRSGPPSAASSCPSPAGRSRRRRRTPAPWPPWRPPAGRRTPGPRPRPGRRHPRPEPHPRPRTGKGSSASRISGRPGTGARIDPARESSRRTGRSCDSPGSSIRRSAWPAPFPSSNVKHPWRHASSQTSTRRRRPRPRSSTGRATGTASPTSSPTRSDVAELLAGVRPSPGGPRPGCRHRRRPHGALRRAGWAGGSPRGTCRPRCSRTRRSSSREAGLALETALFPAEEMPFPDSTFDLVTVRVAPHHFSSPAKFVAEAARVPHARRPFPPDRRQRARRRPGDRGVAPQGREMEGPEPRPVPLALRLGGARRARAGSRSSPAPCTRRSSPTSTGTSRPPATPTENRILVLDAIHAASASRAQGASPRGRGREDRLVVADAAPPRPKAGGLTPEGGIAIFGAGGGHSPDAKNH